LFDKKTGCTVERLQIKINRIKEKDFFQKKYNLTSNAVLISIL
jgi:hypothetical protein